MNIFKTFEIFLMEPLSILKKKFVQIVNVQTDSDDKGGISADLLGQKAQITVYNNDKVYSLLKTVMYKENKKAEEKMLSNLQIKSSVPRFGFLLQNRR